MKKSILIPFALTVLVLGTQCSSNLNEGFPEYYWSEGQKFTIFKNPEKVFIVFEKRLSQKVLEIQPDCEINDLFFSGLIPFENNMDSKVLNGDMGCAMLLRSEAEMVGTNQLYYIGPYYIDEWGKEIAASNLFYVKLKTQSDINELIEIAENLNIEVLGNNEKLPLWWTLSCSTKSAGTTIEMSNYFHETGFFQATSPDIMGQFSPSVSR